MGDLLGKTISHYKIIGKLGEARLTRIAKVITR